MMRSRIRWTWQAKEDLCAIRAFIARDAPRTASAFVLRLKSAVDRLQDYPLSGRTVPELGDPDIREIVFGTYRVIYRCHGAEVHIVTVFHGARVFSPSDIPPDSPEATRDPGDLRS
jgi:addiction module RelE/StbE family toxin